MGFRGIDDVEKIKVIIPWFRKDKTRPRPAPFPSCWEEWQWMLRVRCLLISRKDRNWQRLIYH